MNFKRLLTLLGALALPLLSACGGGDLPQGHVRLVNAAPEYAALDFYQSDTLLVGNVATDSGSDYAGLDKDTYTFRLKRSGTSSTSLITTQSVGKDEYKTVLAYTTAKTLKSIYLSDDEGSPASGNAKLRIFNASSEAGVLDVYLTDNTTDLTTVLPDATAAVEGLGGYGTFGRGTYRLRVTGSGDPTDIRLDLPSFVLGDQQIATLVLTTTSGGVLVNGLLLNQRGAVSASKNPSARVRLAAGASGNGTVSATVNGTVVQASLLSPQVGTTYALVPAGNLTLDVKINGVAAVVPTATATAGADYTLLVLGTGAAGQTTLINDDNRPPSVSGSANLRLVHGLNNLTGGMSFTADFSAIASNLAIGTASTPKTLASGSHRLEVTSPSATSSLYLDTDVTLQDTRVYSLFMLGDASAPVHLLLRDR